MSRDNVPIYNFITISTHPISSKFPSSKAFFKDSCVNTKNIHLASCTMKPYSFGIINEGGTD